MLGLIPEWLLRLILSYVVAWLYKKVGLDATVGHVEAAMAKVTPVPPDPNPPLSSRNTPNHYDG